MEIGLVFLAGLIIGSFLGVLTYRLPRNLNIVSDRSRCNDCGDVIAWYDNIPLLSFVLLKGHCRYCQSKIPLREPLIELATGIIFVVIGINLLYLFLATILISVFIIDLEHQIIPDELVFLGLGILFLYSILYTQYFIQFFPGFLAASLLLFINLVTKGRGMGLGDVKLAILLGFLSGSLANMLIWLFFSFTSGAIIGIMLIMVSKMKLKSKIAFGPFLIIGFVLMIFLKGVFKSIIGL